MSNKPSDRRRRERIERRMETETMRKEVLASQKLHLEIEAFIARVSDTAREKAVHTLLKEDEDYQTFSKIVRNTMAQQNTFLLDDYEKAMIRGFLKDFISNDKPSPTHIRVARILTGKEK